MAHILDVIISTILYFTDTYEASDTTLIRRDLLDDFFNLCHYWPMTIKRHRNVSNNMYKVLNTG